MPPNAMPPMQFGCDSVAFGLVSASTKSASTLHCLILAFAQCSVNITSSICAGSQMTSTRKPLKALVDDGGHHGRCAHPLDPNALRQCQVILLPWWFFCPNRISSNTDFTSVVKMFESWNQHSRLTHVLFLVQVFKNNPDMVAKGKPGLH
jgi:hypothetical protein